MKEPLLVFTTDLYRGGVAESSYKMAVLLSEKYAVTICTYDDTPVNYSIPSNLSVKELKCPLSANFSQTKNGIASRRIKRIIFLPVAILKLVRLISKVRPKTIVSYTYIPNIILLFLKKIWLGKSIKVIISERQFAGTDLLKQGLFGKIVLRLSRTLYPLADLILTPSFKLGEYLQSVYKIPSEKIVHIPNFYNSTLIRQKAEEEVDPEYAHIFDGPVIVNSGRLSQQKGQWFLIRCLPYIHRQHPGVKLVILGDGELMDDLKELADKLKLSKYVFFLGNVANPFKFVKRASIFVFPSLWEGFPNALVEAMICGVPIISADCQTGPSEILNAYPEGCLLPPFVYQYLTDEPLTESEQLLVNQVNKILSHADLALQLSKKSVEIAEQYDVRVVKEKVLTII